MIPRTLHFVWLGPRPLPVEWLRAWRAVHLDWEIRVWNEADIRALPLRNRVTFEAYMAKANYPGAADVARVEILLNVGGVYADIDSEPLRTLTGAPFLEAGFFAAYTLPLEGHPGRIGNQVMGAVRGHPLVRDYAESIDRQPTIWPPWNTTGGTLLTEVVARHRDDPSVVILPAGTFFSEGPLGAKADDGAVAYLRHFWASSPDPVRLYPTKVRVCVPWRPTTVGRDAAWRKVRRAWAASGYEIVTADSDPDKPFNRSQARNRAAQGEWDVAIFADACLLPPDLGAIAKGVERAALGAFVTGHSTVVRLSQDGTAAVLRGRKAERAAVDWRYPAPIPGGIVIVSRALFDRVGGWDEAFEGWGGEDDAFARHCQRVAEWVRVPGVAYHLWHAYADRDKASAAYTRNLARLALIR